MTDRNLAALVAELDALEKKATPGEWRTIAVTVLDAQGYGARFDEDAEFVTALRNAWPALREALKTPMAMSDVLLAATRADAARKAREETARAYAGALLDCCEQCEEVAAFIREELPRQLRLDDATRAGVSGAQHAPLRQIVRTERHPAGRRGDDWVTEVLECGHRIPRYAVDRAPKSGKRRCLDCLLKERGDGG